MSFTQIVAAFEPDSDEANYAYIINSVRAITAGENDIIANMANISAILFTALAHVNWAGFYLYKESQLVLGPFQGSPACIRIPMGKGVCGTAAQTQKVLMVDNVHDFSGHITCDVATNSEIVVPIVKNGRLIGVLDIDSPQLYRFTSVDKAYLCELVDILVDTFQVYDQKGNPDETTS